MALRSTRLVIAAALSLPAQATWDDIDRLAVVAVSELNGDETLLFRNISVFDFERGGDGETRSVCGEVWLDGKSDYVLFIQVFGRTGDRPRAMGLPLVTHRTETSARLSVLWDSFCRNAPRLPVDVASSTDWD